MPPIIHIEETDSTNNYLKNLLLRQDVEEGTVIFTDFQTSGKGQKGNGWESERGKNLLFSVVLYPSMIKASGQFVISQIASLAVADVLSQYTEDITIKWPNDIYRKKKKICGILVENDLMGDTICQSVLGIGININQEKFESNAPNPVSLRQITGKKYGLKKLLDQVVQNILFNYSVLKSDNINYIRERYARFLYQRTGFHLYSDGNHTFSARIKEVEDTGLLVLETEKGEIRKFTFKEIVYLHTDSKTDTI